MAELTARIYQVFHEDYRKHRRSSRQRENGGCTTQSTFSIARDFAASSDFLPISRLFLPPQCPKGIFHLLPTTRRHEIRIRNGGIYCLIGSFKVEQSAQSGPFIQTPPQSPLANSLRCRRGIVRRVHMEEQEKRVSSSPPSCPHSLSRGSWDWDRRKAHSKKSYWGRTAGRTRDREGSWLVRALSTV